MEKKGTKILIFIIILALLGGAIYFILQKDKKPDTQEKIETVNSIKYFIYLSEGYDSKYNGVERLFAFDEFTKEKLTDGIILTAAYRYAMDPLNNIDTTLSPTEYAALENDMSLEDVKPIKGKIIREAIKTLFGIDFKDKGYNSDAFKYSYGYHSPTDIYVRKEKTNSMDDNYSIFPIVVSNTKKGDTVTSEVAIAYLVKNGKKYDIYADAENKELIKSVEEVGVNDFTNKELDKMTKIKVVCKDVDKNYTFEKIEAVK